MVQGLTDKQLSFAKWYIINKKRLYRVLLGFIIILNLIFWGMAIYQFVSYSSLKEAHEQQLRELTAEEIDFSQLRQHFKPNDLIVENPILIPSSSPTGIGHKYDFAVSIENPNEKWRIPSIEYYFSWDGGQTETKKSFILPNEKKYLLALGQAAEQKITNAQFVISGIDWRRVRPGEQIPEVLSKLSIKNIELSYAVATGKMVALPKVSFQIRNGSVYSLWQVNFIIVLYQGSKVVGINILPVKQWQGNEERQVELIWPSVPSHTQIEIRPEVDIFDPTIFIPAY
ncbi:hypothetical protein ISS21_01870 [Patescibacteria group bacterium]|nr:hypothetical protein [Patescibacteria group bacterium]